MPANVDVRRPRAGPGRRVRARCRARPRRRASMTDQTTEQTTGSPTSALAPTARTGPATRGPRILLYSDDRTVRAQVRTAVGPRLRAHAPEIAWAEVATPAALVAAADRG